MTPAHLPAHLPARLVLCLAAALLALAQAHATPLDADTCAKLKVEQAHLENAGVGHNMAKGPEWAKANLAAEKIEAVRRLIEVEEQLLFRCTGRLLVQLPPEPDPDPAAAHPDAAEEGKDGPEASGGTDKKAPSPPAGKQSSEHPKNAPAPPKTKGPAAKDQDSKATKGKEASAGAAGKQAKQTKQTKQGKDGQDGKQIKATKDDGAKASASKAPPVKSSTPKSAKTKSDDAFKPPPSANPAADPFAGQKGTAAKQ